MDPRQAVVGRGDAGHPGQAVRLVGGAVAGLELAQEGGQGRRGRGHVLAHAHLGGSQRAGQHFQGRAVGRAGPAEVRGQVGVKRSVQGAPEGVGLRVVVGRGE